MNVKTMVALSMLVSGSVAQAGLITGSLWVGESGYAALPSPLRDPEVTFQVNTPLDFDSRPGGDYQVGSWLATGGATILTGAAYTGYSINGIVVRFQGMVTVYDGQAFTVEHDDGLTLTIGGISVIDRPGDTAPVVTTDYYSGPSGTFPFDLVYGEGWGPPAVLSIDLPFSQVPEPSTCLAGLSALGMLGLFGWRNRK